MGPEDVSEKMEWEARRVAAAFGVESYDKGDIYDTWPRCAFSGEFQGLPIHWGILLDFGPDYLSIGNRLSDDDCCVLYEDSSATWKFYARLEHHELMARGLYCLGIEDEVVLTELNHPLTAHEKLELKLSMPREFWPKTWLDEEAAK